METQGEWEFVDGEQRPTNSKNAWHKQFAKTPSDRHILGSSLYTIAQKADLCTHTTVLAKAEGGYRRRRGRAITLGELMMAVGKEYTLMEIYYWYHHAYRLCHKKDHPWGSQIVRDASKLRERETGRRGHTAAEQSGSFYR